MGVAENKADTLSAQQLLFAVADLGAADLDYPDIERLPKGEALKIRFELHQSLHLRLGKHNFMLVSGDQFLLIDDSGADIRVAGPRCLVGRGSGCGAMVNERYRSVSRKHLIVETNDDGWVHLTDISSLGTFVPASEF